MNEEFSHRRLNIRENCNIKFIKCQAYMKDIKAYMDLNIDIDNI